MFFYWMGIFKYSRLRTTKRFNSSITLELYFSKRRNTLLIVCYWHLLPSTDEKNPHFGPDVGDCLYMRMAFSSTHLKTQGWINAQPFIAQGVLPPNAIKISNSYKRNRRKSRKRKCPNSLNWRTVFSSMYMATNRALEAPYPTKFIRHNLIHGG